MYKHVVPMQQAYQGQGASKLRMLRASQTDSLSLRRKAITPTRFPPWQPRSWICKGRRACFCPLATLAAAPAPSDNSTAVPVLDLDKLAVSIKRQYNVDPLVELTITQKNGREPLLAILLVILHRYTKYRCDAMDVIWDAYLQKHPDTSISKTLQQEIVNARVGTGRGRYYGAAIGLLNEPQLRVMVKDLLGEEALRDVEATTPKSTAGLEYIPTPTSTPTSIPAEALATETSATEASATETSAAKTSTPSSTSEAAAATEASTPSSNDSRVVDMRIVQTMNKRRLITKLIEWGQQEPTVSLDVPMFLTRYSSIHSEFLTYSTTMDGDRMPVRTIVRLEAAVATMRTQMLSIMKEHFAKLDTCDFDFVSAGPFLTAKGQQVADEWTTTLKECEEDTMQARLMVDGMTFMICDSPDHISLSLMTDAASLDTPPSPITTPTPTAPTPPAVPPTVDLVFDQNALTSLIYGLSEYVAGSMGGGGAGRGWIPSDGMLQVRSGRTLQRARGYPHRLRLTSVERAGEDGVGEVRHKKDVLLTERQLWALIDCIDKYNLSNGFVGLSHQRPTATTPPPLLPMVPSWVWEVVRAGVVLGTLGVLLYFGLQQYSTRMLSKMATMSSPATAAAAAAAVGGVGGMGGAATVASGVGGVGGGGVAAATSAQLQQQGGLWVAAVSIMLGRVWGLVWSHVKAHHNGG